MYLCLRVRNHTDDHTCRDSPSGQLAHPARAVTLGGGGGDVRDVEQVAGRHVGPECLCVTVSVRGQL